MLVVNCNCVHGLPKSRIQTQYLKETFLWLERWKNNPIWFVFSIYKFSQWQASIGPCTDGCVFVIIKIYHFMHNSLEETC